MKKLFLCLVVYSLAYGSMAQQNFYDVTPAPGYGLRFWSNNSYKIHMGNASDYHYGPVTDYSIKINMNNTTGRGWTWGIDGQTPVAALNNLGQMRLAKEMNALNLISRGVIETEGSDYSKIHLTDHAWSGSHAILFNAYKSITTSGSLSATGNTKYANNEGGNFGGAGAIMFFANGGVMDFFITDESGPTSKDTNVTWGVPKMRINRKGKVGIGTGNLDDDFMLSVAGAVRSTEVKVEASPWPDYVFAEDYQLLTLEETEVFINENEHLPNMPSAEEVEENGIALGEMNAKLLEKIEELTLHQIEMMKMLKKQQEIIDQLMKKI